MRRFNKLIQTAILTAVIALPTMSHAEAKTDADLIKKAYTQSLVDSVRSQLYYPQAAVYAGLEGDLKIKLNIDKQGNIIDKKISQKSDRRLDLAIIRMIDKVQPFPVIPNTLEADEFEFEVQMKFILEE